MRKDEEEADRFEEDEEEEGTEGMEESGGDDVDSFIASLESLVGGL